MSDTNKRKNQNEVNKKSKTLVKLGAKADSNERYDSYGYKIEEKKKSIPVPDRQSKTPGRDKKRTGESVYARSSDINKKENNSNYSQNKDKNKEKSYSRYLNKGSSDTKTDRDSNQRSYQHKTEGYSKNTDRYIPRPEERKNNAGVNYKDGRYSDSNKTKFAEEKNKLNRDNSSENTKYSSNENKKSRNKYNRNLIKSDQTSAEKAKKDTDKNRETKDENLRPHEKRLKSKKPKRRKNIEKVLKICGLVLLIVGTVCVFLYGGSSDDDIRKAFLSTGKIESTISSKVCVIKKETPLTANFSGKVVPRVNEGDRVKAGTVVAYIIKPEYESELVALRKIEDKISAAQKASSYIENDHMELSTINTQIYDGAKAFAVLSSANTNFSAYTEIMQNVGNLFETKHEILMNEETTDAYINELKNQRTDILNNLDNYMSEVVTSEAGVVSFYTDSSCDEASEKILQISDYVNKKGQVGNSLNQSSLVFSSNSMKNMQNTDVSEGQVVARVTPDVKYYLSAGIEAKDASSFYPGKNVDIRTKNRSFAVEGKVVEVLTYADKTYVLLESSSGNAGVISSRIMDAEVVVNSAEGLKVPKRALTEWDSARLTARISILRSNYVSYVFVNVLAEDGEYAIIAPSNSFVDEEAEAEGITSVRVNDMYVVNYELVSDGQIIGG